MSRTTNQERRVEANEEVWDETRGPKPINNLPETGEEYQNLSPGMPIQHKLPFDGEAIQGDTQAGSTESFSKT